MIMLRLYPLAKKIPGLRRMLDRAIPMVGDPGDLPRRIFLFWDAGYEAAPELCRACIDSWREHNPGWQVEVLDSNSIADILDRAQFPDEMKPAAFADMLRVHLLARHGGVWADATVLCTRPLDDWLPMLFNQCEVFFFSLPKEDRLVSSWFIAARAGSPAMAALRAACDRYWTGRRKQPLNYLWFHALIEYLALQPGPLRRAFASMPQIGASMCHRVQRAHREGTLAAIGRDQLLHAPMQKLTYRQGIERAEIEALYAAARSGAAASNTPHTHDAAPLTAPHDRKLERSEGTSE